VAQRRRQSLYTFEAFRDDAKARVRLLHARLDEPDASWPGVLLLDIPHGGLSAEAFEIAGISELAKRRLATEQLPAAIRDEGARRFCWVMPVWRRVADQPPQECLLLVLGERGRCEVVVAEVRRRPDLPPALGPWNAGPFGTAARRVAGIFVEPLLAALEPSPR
jgi:hypothetical protein